MSLSGRKYSPSRFEGHQPAKQHTTSANLSRSESRAIVLSAPRLAHTMEFGYDLSSVVNLRPSTITLRVSYCRSCCIQLGLYDERRQEGFLSASVCDIQKDMGWCWLSYASNLGLTTSSVCMTHTTWLRIEKARPRQMDPLLSKRTLISNRKSRGLLWTSLKQSVIDFRW